MRFASRGWLWPVLFVCASVSVAVIAMLHQFFASTNTRYAWGDGAVLELYTIHASHGEWQLGPYSRFGWHHPGPLLFYALSPVYRLFGSHTLALNAGAFAINVASLLVMVWAIVRWARPSVGYPMLAMMTVFLFRVGDITISYWNPHVVAVAFAAFVLVCAALWAGRAAVLPVVVLLGSFVVQTHVSLAPVAAGLTAASLLGLLIAYRSGGSPMRSGSLTWSTAAAVCVLVIAWLPPVAEELSNDPGNLTKLARFFAEPYIGQPWSAAARMWGDSICAVFRSGLRVPTGMIVQSTNGSIWMVLAAFQLIALVLVGRHSSRNGDRFLVALCYVGAVASVLALWSITRIRDFPADYLVFWISALGALNWASLMRAVISRVVATRLDRGLPRLLVRALAIVSLAAFVAVEVAQFRQNARLPPEEPAKRVGVLAEALLAYLEDQQVQRPLVRFSPEVWSDAVGVIVQLYKRGVPIMASPHMVSLLGQPFAPTASADALVDIANSAAHAELSRRPNDRLIAVVGDVYVHASNPPLGQFRP